MTSGFGLGWRGVRRLQRVRGQRRAGDRVWGNIYEAKGMRHCGQIPEHSKDVRQSSDSSGVGSVAG